MIEKFMTSKINFYLLKFIHFSTDKTIDRNIEGSNLLMSFSFLSTVKYVDLKR